MSKKTLHLPGALMAEIDTDNPDMVIHLIYAGKESHSRERFFADEDSFEPTQVIRTPVITEITINDIRAIYMAYLKAQYIRKVENMDDEEFEDYLLRDDC